VPDEIERLYREHHASLVRLVERELHDHHDAEDVVQTAFLDAQRALERGTTPRHPRAWLAAIALNAGRRLRRRHLNAGQLEQDVVQEASSLPEIRAALASLPREQRAAVVYRDVLGLSYAETAAQMGKSVNAVTMLLHRGRRRLRQTLGVTAGAFGLSRWLRQSGLPQVAVLKGAAAVVAAGGLVTTGVAAARVIAPVGAETAAATTPAPSPGNLTKGAAARPSRAVPVLHPGSRHFRATGGSRVSAVTQAPGGSHATPATIGSSTTAKAQSLLPLTVSAPTVPVPVTVAATVTLSTPITAVTVTAPTGTTATVTTPIATVTVPIP
jgi:RNA polymerase sigma factor (sigma-70 family)